MRLRANRRSEQGRESGYALVMIMFFLALLVLSTVVAAPTVLSTIQREKEAEMVWRGEQYTRGVKLYYMKLHRFPTSLEDLTKPKTGIRFMRQEYKDPMNAVDGSWRLIYVGPSGQLIGSLMNHNYGMGGQLAGPTGNGAITSSFSNAGGNPAGASSFTGGMQVSSSGTNISQFGANTPGGATATAQAGADPGDPNAQNSDNPDDPGQPHSIAASMDASNTIGGNIIGVGSKVNRRSFRWYEKAKNYRQFEFIWDPSKDRLMGGASRGIGTAVPNMNGAPGMSSPTPNQGLTPDPNSNMPLQAPPANQ